MATTSRRIRSFAAVLLLFWAVPGLAAQSVHTPALQLPATFRGDLPCADCAAIRYHLDLWPDGVFHLHREWAGRNLARDELGRWRVDTARGVLVLQGGADSPQQWEVKSRRKLRLLDQTGAPIVSNLPYELISSGKLAPARVSLSMGGEMTYLADSLRFTECLTGRSYPVVQEGDALAMERAYLKDVKSPGAPLYVTLQGSIEERLKMEGAGTQTSVVVRRFINAWPAQACERARADSALVNTYWRIARLAGQAVSAVAGRREPNITLRSGEGIQRFSGTVGCNQLGGSFELSGDTLAFGAGVSTMMACPAPLGDLEAALSLVLSKTRRWHVTGATLELADEQGLPLALFEAVYK